jgi:lysine 6-dehydrogenase
MKMLVLGGGLQGSACAYNLLHHDDVESVTVADARPDPLPPFLAALDGPRLRRAALDARDAAAVTALMRGHQAVLCALPYYFNEPMARAALDAGCHFADLGGNTEIVMRQKALDAEARDRELSLVPDCGLAPGMVNVLAAEGIRRLDRAEAVRIYVGGLPQHPEPPLNYQIVYSLEGALDYYTTPSWVLRGGKAVPVEALTEVESLDFALPVGTLEAFHTAGGISTMPFAFEGAVETMEYKTLRYPGHAHIMRAIRDLGLLANTPIEVKGQSVVPRDLFIAAVSPQLTKPEGRDLVALRVVATGTRAGRPATMRFDLLDFHDAESGLSAMMRTTGFSLALTGLMQARRQMRVLGAHTPDEAVPFRGYVDGLARFGVRIEESES